MARSSMSALWISVLLMGLLCLFCVIFAFFLSSNLRVYNKRGDQSTLWREKFAASEFEEVGRILNMLCSAYMIPASAAWCLRPDDVLADIQQQCTRRLQDDLQHDIFLVQLSDYYHWKPVSNILPLSLAEIISLILGER
ncbi:MAG: hypothetical protein HRU15_00775 [Planctomycetes bacterium]|nr:hypothetical protein [Planctomycetota bacterium]